MTITAIIVDDELKASQNLQLLLNKYCEQVIVLATAQTVPEAINAICEHRPQLLFLDVHIGSKQSFEILEKTEHIDKLVIFTTGYKEYAVEAFRCTAVDYLLKPICVADLQRAVAKAIRQTHLNASRPSETRAFENGKKIFVPERYGWRAVEIEHINYLEADRSYAKIHLLNKEVLTVSKNLKYFEHLLAGHPQFIRVQRSYIINAHYVRNILKQDSGYVVLENSEKVPVSKDLWDHLLLMLNILNAD